MIVVFGWRFVEIGVCYQLVQQFFVCYVICILIIVFVVGEVVVVFYSGVQQYVVGVGIEVVCWVIWCQVGDIGDVVEVEYDMVFFWVV